MPIDETGPRMEVFIPQRLRELRKRADMTLADVARKAGTTPQSIQRMETGGMTMSLYWLDQIMAAIGAQPSDVFQTKTLDQLTAKAAAQARRRIADDLHAYADRIAVQQDGV